MRAALRALWFLALPAALVWLGFFLQQHDWEWGRQRSALLALAALAVLVARPQPPAVLRTRGAAVLLTLLALAALARDVRTGIESVRLAATAGVLRLDQGQNTLRAARLLLRGEDPYAQGQLLDLEAYDTRGPQRREAGLGAAADPRFVRVLERRWWNTLDPAAREALLPPASGEPALRERALYGYKYGPVLPLVTATLAPAIGASAVPVLQLAAWAALLVALSMLLATAGVPWAAVMLAVLCISLEPGLSTNALFYTASDVWALAAMAVALLAFVRRWPVVAGLCAGAAVGCKLLPSLLLVPLVVVAGPRAWVAFAATVTALFGPFAVADPAGLWANLVRWPAAMQPDNTAWSFYATEPVRLAGRAAAGAILLAGAVWLVVRRTRDPAPWLRWLACGSAVLILGGVAFHNNYLPWFTVWAFSALVASLRSDPESASAHAPAASGNR